MMARERVRSSILIVFSQEVLKGVIWSKIKKKKKLKMTPSPLFIEI